MESDRWGPMLPLSLISCADSEQVLSSTDPQRRQEGWGHIRLQVRPQRDICKCRLHRPHKAGGSRLQALSWGLHWPITASTDLATPSSPREGTPQNFPLLLILEPVLSLVLLLHSQTSKSFGLPLPPVPTQLRLPPRPCLLPQAWPAHSSPQWVSASPGLAWL